MNPAIMALIMKILTWEYILIALGFASCRIWVYSGYFLAAALLNICVSLMRF